MLCNPSFRDSGNILPSYFVIVDPAETIGYCKVAASASVDADNWPLGVSQEGTKDAPGTTGASAYAATDEDPIDVYGQGDVCLLTIGSGGCTAGQLLKPDSTGKGIIIDTSSGGAQFYGARALETAIEDDLCRVQVMTGFYTS